MFGDWGHGICLLLGAIVLIVREKKLGSQVCHLLSFDGMNVSATFVETISLLLLSLSMDIESICFLLLHSLYRVFVYLHQKLGSFMEMLFGGRYVLLSMSLFSIYCGLVYNEFFSVPFHIFGSSAYRCRDASCR